MPLCYTPCSPLPAPLIQIRRRTAAIIGDLSISVESDGDGWLATVAGGGRTLYSAQRCSMAAAKAVAIEYTVALGTVFQQIDWN